MILAALLLIAAVSTFGWGYALGQNSQMDEEISYLEWKIYGDSDYDE